MSDPRPLPTDFLPSCEFCVEGFQPAGIHPVLGPVFQLCLVCIRACPSCDGFAVFPAFGMFGGYRLHDALAKRGLFVTQCRTCGGVTAVAPVNQEAPRHDHT